MVASECAPAAQAGGLGQVVFGLSRELELRGHAVEIILPKYDCMHYDQIFGLTVAYWAWPSGPDAADWSPAAARPDSQRVTGSWVTVTGNRREDELLIWLYDASPAG